MPNQAKSPLYLLLLGSDPHDPDLVVEALKSAQLECEITWVTDKAAFETALRDRQYHVVLADQPQPDFDNLKAFTLAQQKWPWTPFLVLTESLPEDQIQDLLHQGATACVSKKDTKRLVSALRRAVRATNERVGRLRAEAALRESQALRSAILDAALDSIIGLDSEGHIIEFNPAAEKTFGYSRAEALGQFLNELITPPGPRRDTCRGPAEYLGSAKGRCEELTVRHRDGREFPAELTVARADQTDTPVFTAILRDITERKRNEQSRLLAEAKYRSIFENAREGIFQTSPEGRYLTVNPALARMYGYDSPEAMMTSLTDIGSQLYVEPECRAELARRLEEQDSITGFESEVFRSDGSKIWIVENVRAVRDATGGLQYYEGTVLDISERKRLENQLRHAQKMDAIGQLAGGVAHDFNNILTVISASVHMLQMDAQLTPEGQEHVDQIQAAAERASGLTRQLLTFSRKQVAQPRLLDLNQVVKGFGKMLNRLIGADIKLELENAAQLPSVRADLGMMEQVLMNLAVNARDAMPQGGKLLIKTETTRLDEACLKRQPAATPGDFVCLTVRDTGCGMPPEVMARIFEPFFTTKAFGKGTGLGLATVYGIVQQHVGWVEVASQVGEGTTFRVFLPAHEEFRPKPEPAPAPVTAPHGSQTILVVEDDPSVRSTAKLLLEWHGYQVLDVETGIAALKVWEQRAGDIALLFTDLVLPDGITGRQLAIRLQEKKPGLKVVYSSGYSPQAADRMHALEPGASYLQKPYRASQLIQMVFECLNPATAVRAAETAKA